MIAMQSIIIFLILPAITGLFIAVIIRATKQVIEQREREVQNNYRRNHRTH